MKTNMPRVLKYRDQYVLINILLWIKVLIYIYIYKMFIQNNIKIKARQIT